MMAGERTAHGHELAWHAARWGRTPAPVAWPCRCPLSATRWAGLAAQPPGAYVTVSEITGRPRS
jgi:hypothetical protein